ncbi:MAG: mechanosensitive ion channel [Robiginitomaculum sp.]
MENTTDITRIVTNPIGDLMEKIGLPESIAPYITAAVVIFIGLVIAWLISKVIASAINGTGLGKKARTTGGNIGKSLAKAAFWIIWLMFILSALSGFEALSGAGKPLAALNSMMTKIFEFMPNIIVGLLIGVVGWIISNVARITTTSTLEAMQVDRIVNKFNVNDEESSSNTIAKALGGLVFGILLLLFSGEAFAKIGLTDISAMLKQITGYLPEVFGATAILVISVIIARFVAKLANNILPSIGFDSTIRSIGGLNGESSVSGTAPSKIIGMLAFVSISLMGLMAAFRSLGIQEITNIFEIVLSFGGRITVGLIIIGIGFFIAGFIGRIGAQAWGEKAGNVIKYATIVLITFMGLGEMNIGGGIVATAFGSFVYAAAFAAGVGGAIAFGLGGREWAKGKLNTWAPVKRKTVAKNK